MKLYVIQYSSQTKKGMVGMLKIGNNSNARHDLLADDIKQAFVLFCLLFEFSAIQKVIIIINEIVHSCI